MTWGSDCSMCGREDCSWVHGDWCQGRAKAAEARVVELTTKVGSLFDAVAHGDEEHMAWLKTAIADHFAGRPVERPSGKGMKEALTARVGEMEAALEKVIQIRAGLTGIPPDRMQTKLEQICDCVGQALAGLSDEASAKSGSPAPVGEHPTEWPSPVSLQEIYNMTGKERAQYEAERAVVEAAMDKYDKTSKISAFWDSCPEIWDACHDYAKAREAGGE